MPPNDTIGFVSAPKILRWIYEEAKNELRGRAGGLCRGFPEAT